MPYKDRNAQLAAQQKNYEENKEKFGQRQRDRRKKLKEFIADIKEKSSCDVCGEEHPAVLDFHHKDPNQKDFQLADISKRKWSIKRLESEIAKCHIWCSNCHRKFHWEERQTKS